MFFLLEILVEIARLALNVDVAGQNAFAILATLDDVMRREYDMDKAARKVILDDIKDTSDYDVFLNKVRFYFLVTPELVAGYTHAISNNPYIADCDNCDEYGICPDYNEGAPPGATMQCDACGD